MANMQVWRVSAVLYNIVNAISGLVLFGASCFLLYRLVSYREFIGGDVDGPAITLLFMGLITCIVSCICWRSVFNIRRPQILMHSIIIFAILVAEFTCFVWSLVLWENLELSLKITVSDYFLSSTHGKDETAIAKWDRIQNDLKCCGPGGPGDYRSAQVVPWSCCSSSVGPHSPDCGTVYQRGCINPVYDYARDQLIYVALAALAASLLQILGLVLTCCLFNSSAVDNNNTSVQEGLMHGPEVSRLHLPENNEDNRRKSSTFMFRE